VNGVLYSMKEQRVALRLCVLDSYCMSHCVANIKMTTSSHQVVTSAVK